MIKAESYTGRFPLRQRLAQQYAEYRAPFEVTLELTNRCNLNCTYCYIVHDEEPELSTAEWKSVLDELADVGCFEVLFTGGEPLMRRDFLDIARHARRRRFVIIFFTNATLITEDIADEIADIHPSVVEVTLYGTAATDSRITGVKGSFERSIQGIRHLKSRGVRVVSKLTWVKEVFQDYDHFMSLVDELGTPFRASVWLNYRRNGSSAPQEHTLDDDQLFDLMIRANEHELQGLDEKTRQAQVDEVGTRIRSHIPGPCGAGRSSLCVSATGEVYPCVGLTLNLGNIREASITDIWKDSEGLRKLRAITPEDYTDCMKCDVSHYCTFCPGDNLLEERPLMQCDPEARRIATVMKKAHFESLGLFDVCPS